MQIVLQKNSTFLLPFFLLNNASESGYMNLRFVPLNSFEQDDMGSGAQYIILFCSSSSFTHNKSLSIYCH